MTKSTIHSSSCIQVQFVIFCIRWLLFSRALCWEWISYFWRVKLCLPTTHSQSIPHILQQFKFHFFSLCIGWLSALCTFSFVFLYELFLSLFWGNLFKILVCTWRKWILLHTRHPYYFQVRTEKKVPIKFVIFYHLLFIIHYTHDSFK